MFIVYLLQVLIHIALQNSILDALSWKHKKTSHPLSTCEAAGALFWGIIIYPVMLVLSYKPDLNL